MTACIVGWAHMPFGKHEALDVEGLIDQVAGAAIEDAGIAATEIDGVFVGLFNNGFSKQDFPSSLPLQSIEALRFKPSTRYENACASGTAAIHGARDFLAAGRGRFSLVLGVEKMTATPRRRRWAITSSAPATARKRATSPPASPACSAASPSATSRQYGDQSDALAAIAAKNHKNGVDNPYAQMRKRPRLRFLPQCQRKKPLCRPTAQAHGLLPRQLTAPPPSSSPTPRPRAPSAKAVGFRAAVHVNDYLPLSKPRRHPL